MRRAFIFTFASFVAIAGWSQEKEKSGDLVFVKGGTFKNSVCTNYFGRHVTVSDFYIGKYEVTQKEWNAVLTNNPSKFKSGDMPVEMVTWYECVEYCNKRSIKEGLKPYYDIDKNTKDTNNLSEGDELKWTVTVHEGANGYRLPTEAEWEYAATGGQKSKCNIYSGSDEVDKVAWYWQNSGDKNLTGFWNFPAIQQNHDQTRPVGGKDANELGLYDMSGNVREWCWDWLGELPGNAADPQGSSRGNLRVWKGGGWMGADFCCEPSFRAGYEPFNRGDDQGFRVCRGK